MLLTADHDFMYQESALDVQDKSTLEEKPSGMLRAKKRYLIEQGIGVNPKVWCSNTSVTAGTEVGLKAPNNIKLLTAARVKRRNDQVTAHQGANAIAAT